MAVYKPTDCSPFGGSFDFRANASGGDLPIFIECKVDTSNTNVSAYSVKVYDNENNLVFPKVNGEYTATETITSITISGIWWKPTKFIFDGTKISNFTWSKDYGTVTFTGSVAAGTKYTYSFEYDTRYTLSDIVELEDYFNNNYQNYGKGYTNLNTGLNGSYIKIPFFIPSPRPSYNSYKTLNRNICPADENVKNGFEYKWNITLYQKVEFNNQSEYEAVWPDQERYYDMSMTTGQVLGSTNKRLQTPLLASDEEIVKNLVLSEKYVQLVNISNLSYNDDNPKNWTNTNGTITEKSSRVLVDTYDSTYGHVYPSESGDNVFADGIVSSTQGNAIRIYKNGNNPDNLGTSDKVQYLCEDSISEGTSTSGWYWDSSNSRWQNIYTSSESLKPSAPYSLNGMSLSGGERIVLNNMQKNAVSGGGSPYNGIFYPTFTVSGSSGNWTITSYWNRTTDADSWGELLNKVVYIENNIGNQNIAGKNYEINVQSTAGVINSTPFKFVEEKAVKLLNITGNTTTASGLTTSPISGNLYCVTVGDGIKIGEIVSVSVSGTAIDKSKINYVLNSNIVYFESSSAPTSGSVSVSYYAFQEQNYTVPLFFNRKPTQNKNGIIYIRPFSGLGENMIFKKITSNVNDSYWFPMTTVNDKYWYLDYANGAIKPTGAQDVTSEGDKYRIKSFYRQSDLNPFGVYQNPTITPTVTDITGAGITQSGDEVYHVPRDFKISFNYEQNNYISWKSYQMVLYETDSSFSTKKSVIETVDETYDGNISHLFKGLDGEAYYHLYCVFRTNSESTIEKKYKFRGNFTETFVNPLSYGATISFDESIRAIKIFTGIFSTVENNVDKKDVCVYRREIWNDKRSSSPATNCHSKWEFICDNIGRSTAVYDYSVCSGRTYEYSICKKFGDRTTSTDVIRLSYSPSWIGWSVIELNPMQNSENSISYIANPKDVWNFKYNVSSGAQSQNVAKAQQDTLSRFPRFSHGEKNHISGQVSCLLGREMINADYRKDYKYTPPTSGTSDGTWAIPIDGYRISDWGGYKEALWRCDECGGDYKSAESVGFTDLISNEAVDMLDKWRTVCYSGNLKLLKNEKGQMFYVQIMNPSNTTNEYWNGMPDQVSFDWVEIQNNKKIVVANVESYCMVSATATNATVNGSTSYSGTVLNGGTLTLTLGANGTSHKLPTSVTVAEVPVPSGNEHSISGVCTATYTRTDNVTGTLKLGNFVASELLITVTGSSI